MRLINVACDAGFTFSIDNHTMYALAEPSSGAIFLHIYRTVIETDSVENEPMEVDSLVIYAGEQGSCDGTDDCLLLYHHRSTLLIHR
jgi:iron transport multicopper oxidase